MQKIPSEGSMAPEFAGNDAGLKCPLDSLEADVARAEEEVKEAADVVAVVVEAAIAELLVVEEVKEEVDQGAVAVKDVDLDALLLTVRCRGVAVGPILHQEGSALAPPVVQTEPPKKDQLFLKKKPEKNILSPISLLC